MTMVPAYGGTARSLLHPKTLRLYSVVVITFGFDPNNPGSNPGTTYFFWLFLIIMFFSHLRSAHPEVF